MPFRCPHCKAEFPSGQTCKGRFDLGQLREIEQPGYYAVHHLSVPCYMLQHNAYSRRGWIEARKLLGKFVHDSWTPEMARRQHRLADRGKRNWSYTRGARLPGVEEITWSFTVADVRLETAEAYCADVRRWAECVLADSEDLIRRLEVA